MHETRFGPALLERFDHLYVINLPERRDRREEMERQLADVGLDPADSRITFFPAARGTDSNGFPSPGAHGCFLSHLSILKEARARGYRNALIAEDDLDFAPAGRELGGLLHPLEQQPWHFLFGGYHFPERFLVDGTGLVDVGGRYSIGGSHLYAVSGDVFDAIIEYLERALAGPAPKPHVDVAISEFRASFPGCVTFVVSPAIGVQRRSRSDVQSLRFFDRIAFLRPLANALRSVAGQRKS